MLRINYIGKFTAANGNSYRLAEICFDEVDERKAFRIIDLMRIKGWDIEHSIYGWAVCEVFDRDEYKDFAHDWREAKHCITQCMKYGF